MKLLPILLALASTMAGAGTTITESENSGIVTPNVATGFYATYAYNNDTKGNIVLCPRDKIIIFSSCEKGEWQPISYFVPPNKTYAGFRLVGPTGSGRMIEIYWK